MCTPEAVAAASAGADDLPHVLFTASGSGHKRRARVDASLSSFVALVRGGGRVVAFDRPVSAPGALDEALAAIAFNTATLSGRRQLCVMRDVDLAAPADLPRLKRLLASPHHWWAMSAASASRLGLDGFFLRVRASKEAVGALPLEAGLRELRVADVPRLSRVADVAAAVASGASLDELVEAFRRLALRRLPRRAATEAAWRLDLDLKTTLRPLMISALIEDAIRDVEDLAAGG